MAVENWDTNHALNNVIEGEDISEGMLPGPLNNVIRKICAEVRTFLNKTYRKNETIKATAAGAADPFAGTQAENDIWIEYTP